MAGEGRVRGSDPEHARPARDGSVTLGLIPAPDIPEKIANEIAPGLPGLLRRHVDEATFELPPLPRQELTSRLGVPRRLADRFKERCSQKQWQKKHRR